MAYKTLLRGVHSAQRVNNSGQTTAALAGLWAMPAVRTSVLGAAAAVTAAVSRAKSKPRSGQSRGRLRGGSLKGRGVTTGSTARDIMSKNTQCASVSDSLVDAARKMRDLDVGALPACGEDDRLRGMITDRDIVVKCIAAGGDPRSTTVSMLAEGKPMTMGADDSVEEALRTMSQHGVRRLPVIDGQQLVGMVSQADVKLEVCQWGGGDG